MSTLIILLALTLSTAEAKPGGSKPTDVGSKPTAGSERRDPPAPTERTSRPKPAPAPQSKPSSSPRSDRGVVQPSDTPRTVPTGPRTPVQQSTPAPSSSRGAPTMPSAVGGDPLGSSRSAPSAPARELPTRGGTPIVPTTEPDRIIPGQLIELLPVAGDRIEDVSPPQHGYRQEDPRYSRPRPRHVRDCPYAYDPAPWRASYHGWYGGWYVHPYYRWQYSTYVMIHTGWGSFAWVDTWAPGPRAGWIWVPGSWIAGYWSPGYWAPAGPVPRGYAYVPGYWHSDYYVEGYYRSEDRDDGDWEWVEGQYIEDGSYIRGHWRPTEPGPEGYTWEAGFWDGENYIDGFWRPMFRDGFVWASAYFDVDGIYHSGFWKPLQTKPEHIWVPGWFDGNGWQEGYWVHEGVYYSQRPEEFDSPEGYDAGWDEGSGWGDGEVVERHDLSAEEAAPAKGELREPSRPLGIPVE